MRSNRIPPISALPFILVLFLLSEISCFEEHPHPHLLVTFERVSGSDGALKYKEVSSKQAISQSQQTQPFSQEAGAAANVKYDKNILPQNKLTNSPLGPGTGDNMDSHGINIDTNKIEQSDEVGEERKKTQKFSNLIEHSEKIIENVADKGNSFVRSNGNEACTSAVKFQQSDITFSSFALIAISIIAFLLYL